MLKFKTVNSLKYNIERANFFNMSLRIVSAKCIIENDTVIDITSSGQEELNALQRLNLAETKLVSAGTIAEIKPN
ncbi:hypothetical protein BpHYR1_046948 [Brachionus plicatilis]|uniref:Uncharacterized protein n=1 Tax=Brachionus plicatilis TaxID=10195 RepID=A0A3M7PJX5_BRAPC|nr:hypothetical protein BpHYR1_046948 [Brachionus plicatilis]